MARAVRDIGTSERVLFEGGLEEISEFFLRNRLTDGLPIVPPTEDLVRKMLAGADRGPEEVVAKLEPAGGSATVEKIAINAVMAGARPEYLPVIIAAVEATAEPAFNLHTTAISTASVTPFVVVSGKIAGELGINSGAGCLGPGWQANATIGRTLRLIIMNVAGAYPGEKDMGGFGHPGRYAMVMAEAEDKSPWRPLREDLGFGRETSTVTVVPIHDYTLGVRITGSDSEASPTRAFLLGITAHLNRVWHPFWVGSPTVVLLTPHVANLFGREGWSKEDLKNILYQQARSPVAEIPQERILQAVKAGLVPRWFRDLSPGHTVPVAAGPEKYVIIVGGFSGATQPVILQGLHGDMATKEIRVPKRGGRSVPGVPAVSSSPQYSSVTTGPILHTGPEGEEPQRLEEAKRRIMRRVEKFAVDNLYQLNPQAEMVALTIDGLAENDMRYGYPCCTCRVPTGVAAEDKDIVCPCADLAKQVAEFGQCHCGLFVKGRAGLE